MADRDSTPVELAFKKCFRCKQEKPVGEFHKNRTTKDGLQPACIACAKTVRKPSNPESAADARNERLRAKTMGVKACRSCGQVKPLVSDFWAKSPRGLGGFDAKCKDCQADTRQRKLRPDTADKRAETRALADQGMKRCPACGAAKPLVHFIRRANGGYYSYCLECFRHQSADARARDVEGDRRKKLASYHRRREVVGDAMRATRNLWRRRKRREDSVFSMSERVRGLLGQALRRMGYTKNAKTQAILGCSWQYFAAHIERQFLKGMSWGNRDEWHIDHIVPLATAETEEDVIRLNHFTNLRPMWAKDNLSKGAQVTHLI